MNRYLTIELLPLITRSSYLCHEMMRSDDVVLPLVASY